MVCVLLDGSGLCSILHQASDISLSLWLQQMDAAVCVPLQKPN